MIRHRLVAHMRAFVVEHKRMGGLVQRAVNRFPVLHDVAARVVRTHDSQRTYAQWLAQYDALDEGISAGAGALPVIGLEDGALRATASEFVILVASDTILRRRAAWRFGRAIAEHPQAVVLYGDDDAIDDRGVRFDPYFKPDWNPTLFHAQNYLAGAVCVRRARAIDAGGINGADSDPLWSLLLRVTAAARPEEIVHIPFVLSHRRSDNTGAPDAGAHRARLSSIGVEAEIVERVGRRSFRVGYAPRSCPPVSIVIPTTGRADLLQPCLDAIVHRTTYPSVDVTLVVGRRADEVLEREGVRVLRSRDGGSFNFARTMNWAARRTQSPLICFVNDDTEALSAEWLAALVAHVQRDRVAAVGAKLLFPTGRIQHAGIVVGAGIVAAHAYRGERDGILGYHDRALVAQDVSAVTAACMLIRREAFDAVGGFDERLAIAFNDIDLCLRLRDAGWRIVWTPESTLRHKESVTTGRHDARGHEWAVERDAMFERWGRPIWDPHYNPNLSLDAMQMWQPAFPPRVRPA